MSYMIPSPFTFVHMDEMEKLSGYALTQVHEDVIQNDLAEIAQQLLTLSFDAEHPTKFLQEQAYLKGQLEMLQNMLARSKEAQKLLVDVAAAQAANTQVFG